MAASSTKYFKNVDRVWLSRNANYSDPLLDRELTTEFEATRYKTLEVLAATGGTTVDLSEFGTILKIKVFNRDSSNYVKATFRTAANGANDNILAANAGDVIDLGYDITVANDLVLTANGAAIECIVEIYGTV